MRKSGRQTELTSALNQLVKKLDRNSGGAYRQTQIDLCWKAVCGPMVASHTTGAHLKKGVLVVYVDSAIWANELSVMSEQYRKAVNTNLGQETVESVRFSVSRKVQEKRSLDRAEEEEDSFYSADETEPVPLSEKEIAEVRESTEAIPDPGLREAVFKATVKSLEWQKGIQSRNAPQKASDGR
ncbi:MAG: DUF721 domain-containing protein [Coriobacteriia bacterium]